MSKDKENTQQKPIKIEPQKIEWPKHNDTDLNKGQENDLSNK